MPRLGSSDLEVSTLCLGTNVFGWNVDEREAHRVLDAFADAGGNFLDTADVYSAWLPGHEGGESETILAAADESLRRRAGPAADRRAPIASARTPEQLADLLPVQWLKLTGDELAQLTAASAATAA